MNSRMDRYDGTLVKARTEKNKRLYEEVSEMNVNYIDINVDNAIEIDTFNSGNLTRTEYQRKKEFSSIIPSKEETKIETKKDIREEERVYDINEILKLARENKLFESDEKKRLINTEYNILTKLDISKLDEKKTSSKEDLRNLIDTIYGNSKDKEKENKEVIKENALLHDLMDDNDTILSENTSKDILDKEVSLDKDLDEEEGSTLILNEEDLELEETEDVDITKEVEVSEDEEVEKEETNDDEDTEDVDLMEINDEIKRSKVILIIIIIIVLLLLAVGGYLFYKYFI